MTSQEGGNVPRLHADDHRSDSSSGTIYYTLDGTDPRVPDGEVSGEGGTVIMAEGNAFEYVVPQSSAFESNTGNGASICAASAGPNQWTGLSDPPPLSNGHVWGSGGGDRLRHKHAQDADFDNQAGLIDVNSEDEMYLKRGIYYLRYKFNVDLASLGSSRSPDPPRPVRRWVLRLRQWRGGRHGERFHPPSRTTPMASLGSTPSLPPAEMTMT
ncbi:MAG: hypothetical protein R3F11_27605 [Verrucomicrobiales bacterium]